MAMCITSNLKISNRLGLHARASAKLVDLSCKFSSEILIGVNPDNMVSAKSIIAVMLLAAAYGTKIYLKITGDDAKQALTAITSLINNKFDEGI